MLEVAGRVVADATGQFESTEFVHNVDLVTVGLGPQASGDILVEIWVESISSELLQWTLIRDERFRLSNSIGRYLAKSQHRRGLERSSKCVVYFNHL